MTDYKEEISQYLKNSLFAVNLIDSLGYVIAPSFNICKFKDLPGQVSINMFLTKKIDFDKIKKLELKVFDIYGKTCYVKTYLVDFSKINFDLSWNKTDKFMDVQVLFTVKEILSLEVFD